MFFPQSHPYPSVSLLMRVPGQYSASPAGEILSCSGVVIILTVVLVTEVKSHLGLREPLGTCSLRQWQVEMGRFLMVYLST